MAMTPEERLHKYRPQRDAYALAHKEEKRAYDAARYRAKSAEKRAQVKAYRIANKEKKRQADRAYRLKHPEKRRLYSRRYYQRHPDRCVASIKAYRAKHPEMAQEASIRRRARVAGAAINDFTAAQWKAMKAAYGYRCVYCQRHMRRLTRDHIIPLSKGGNHTFSNIVPACHSCNARKNAGDVLSPVQPLLLLG